MSDLVPADPVARLHAVVDHAWDIFTRRYLAGRHPIEREAPFQHHFAAIVAELGRLYCLHRDDVFFVDLERRADGLYDGRSKYVDIVCEARWHDGVALRTLLLPLELKYKTARQGAEDHGRIDAYIDIEAVERFVAVHPEAVGGRFLMITDNGLYVRPSRRGVGTVFATHLGHRVGPVEGLACPESKGREDVRVTLRGSYEFAWIEQERRWFLSLVVAPNRTAAASGG